MDGMFHLGRYFYAATGESYRGSWSNGKRHGRGIYTYGQAYLALLLLIGREEVGEPYNKMDICVGNGNVFEGEFVAGLKEGPGVLTMVTGDHIGRLEGLWKDDEITSGVLQ